MTDKLCACGHLLEEHDAYDVHPNVPVGRYERWELLGHLLGYHELTHATIVGTLETTPMETILGFLSELHDYEHSQP